MAKKSKPPTFDEILTNLRASRFDVAPAPSVANASSANLMQVSKYGCAALIGAATGDAGKAPASGSGPVTAQGRGTALGKGRISGPDAPVVAILGRGGVVVGNEIGHILDKGYQKFIKTPHAELPATAEHLRALHRFSEELRQLTGNISLYNESLGTVSDEYVYDRVKGRTTPENERATPAWALPGK